MAFEPEAKGLCVKLNTFSITHTRKSMTELDPLSILCHTHVPHYLIQAFLISMCLTFRILFSSYCAHRYICLMCTHLIGWILPIRENM